jgi:hypothetical protein
MFHGLHALALLTKLPWASLAAGKMVWTPAACFATLRGLLIKYRVSLTGIFCEPWFLSLCAEIGKGSNRSQPARCTFAVECLSVCRQPTA